MPMATWAAKEQKRFFFFKATPILMAARNTKTTPTSASRWSFIFSWNAVKKCVGELISNLFVLLQLPLSFWAQPCCLFSSGHVGLASSVQRCRICIAWSSSELPPTPQPPPSQRTRDTPRPTPHRTHRPIGRPGTVRLHDNRGGPSQMVSMLQTQKEGMGGKGKEKNERK